VSLLPKAIVLRSGILDSADLLKTFGDYLIYVALIDTKLESWIPELGYLYQDWISKNSEASQNSKKFTFAILDWSYVDQGNPKLFETFGFT
jgi:hypothetical protein